MEDVERLLKTAMGEVERLLSTKAVVGEPITYEGNTVIPLVSVGFGFGAGGGTGKMKSGEAGEGVGSSFSELIKNEIQLINLTVETIQT